MKKLIVVTLALMQVGKLFAGPLQQELASLTSKLRVLEDKLENQAPLPPTPALTQAEKDLQKELDTRPVPPPPGGVLSGSMPQPPKTMPGGTSGVKPQPQPDSGSDDNQNKDQDNIPKPPPPPGAGTSSKPVVKPVVKPEPVKFKPQVASPLYEKSVKKDVLNPQRKSLLAAHEDGNLSAVIGITPEGSLVVYGPVLKQDKPAATQFFQNGRQFMYPNTDQVRFTMDAGKAKAEYAIYEIINMPELMAQKKFFDAIEQQIKQIQARRKDADDLDRAQQYVGDLRNLVAAVVVALKNPLLAPAKLHGKLTNESLTVAHVIEVISNLRLFIDQVLAAAETRLKKSEKEKTDKFDEWRTQGTNTDKLLESRWNADKSLSRIKTDLEKLPTVIAQLKAIDLTQLGQLVTELNQQNNNKQRQNLDAYYAALYTTGREAEVSGAGLADEEEPVDENVELSAAEEARLDELQIKLKNNRDDWFANSEKKSALEKTAIKDDLAEYLRLKRKANPEWLIGTLQGLYQVYGVSY